MLLTVRPGSHYLAHELAAEALVVQGGEVRVLNSQSHQDLIPLLDKVLPPHIHGTARVTITRHKGGTKCNDSLSERVGGGQVPHALFFVCKRRNSDRQDISKKEEDAQFLHEDRPLKDRRRSRYEPVPSG